MKIVRSLLRLYSYLFQAAFIVVSLAMAVLMLASGRQTVNFYLLPWEKWTLTTRVSVLMGLAVIGIFVLLMAVRGRMQKMVFLWTVVVLLLVARYFLLSPLGYTARPGAFSGGFTNALLLILAALIAVLGASMKSDAKAG